MTTEPTDPPRRRTFTERLGGRHTPRGFVERVRANPTDLYLVRGKDSTGRRAWYYFRVGRGKKRAFEAKQGTPDLKLTEYGTIIISGYGQDPPPAVVARMSTEYGFTEATTSAAESDD